MFSYGFYNSKNGDRKYNATHFGKIFDGVIQDGVFGTIGNLFKLEPKETPSLEAIINPGKAWLMHTWNILDAKATLTFNSVVANYKRTDVVVLEVNNNYDTGEFVSRTNSIKIIEGSPVAMNGANSVPALTQIWNTNNTERRIWQYPLAYVTIYGSDYTGGTTGTSYKANIIQGSNIESRINVSGALDSEKYITWTPMVSGATMNLSLSDYIPDWNNVFNQFIDEENAKFKEWFNTISNSYVGAFLTFSGDQFQPNVTYYENVSGDYIPTSDASPVSGKTYYYYNTSVDIRNLDVKINNKIIYGDYIPTSLDPGQVYLQIEE